MLKEHCTLYRLTRRGASQARYLIRHRGRRRRRQLLQARAQLLCQTQLIRSCSGAGCCRRTIASHVGKLLHCLRETQADAQPTCFAAGMRL